ncbi:MAG: Rad52/Rad22 family DNA repair protein [Anaerolineales bacterium]
MSQFDFSQILAALQEPFPSEYIEWKPQSVSKDGKRAVAAAYVDARRYQERLDLVCPGWSSHIELLADGQVAKVALTIEGVTREDVGEASSEEANTVTTAVAQAFKRACTAFGLGRYLYFLPLTWCDYDAEKKRIINPPQLPRWAVPEAEREARQLNDEALEKAHQAKPAFADNGSSSQPAPTAEAEEDLANPGETVIHFGKMNGKTLAQVWAEGKEGQGWVRWCASTDGKGFDPKGKPENTHLQRMARAFLMLHAAYAG